MLLDAAVDAGARRPGRGRDRCGQHRRRPAGGRRAGDGRAACRSSLASRCPAGAVSTALRVPGRRRDVGAAGAIPAGTLCAIKARVALALGLGAGLDASRPRRRSWPTRYPDRPMPLDTLITGRIATLAGDDGLRLGRGHRHPRRAGGVRRLGGRPRDPRRPVHRADPAGARPGRHPRPDRRPPPSRPGRARRQRRPTSATPRRWTRAWRGWARPTRRLPADAWLEGHGWDSDRWGGWPTADDLERWRPGRRAALWAHDHHALWASHAALARGRAAGADDPPGGVVRRAADGSPEGVLYETATRLVTVHVPPLPTRTSSMRRSMEVGRDLVVARASSPATTRAASRRTRTWATRSRRTPGCPTPAGCRSGSTPACATTRSPAAIERGLPERCAARRRTPTAGPRSAGRSASPTARSGRGRRPCSRTSRPSPTDRCAPELRRGVWMTDPAGLRERVGTGVGRRDRDEDPRHRRRGGPRRARRARPPVAATRRSCRASSTSRCSTPTTGRGSPRPGIAASVQPVHLGSDAAQAWKLWGDRAEAEGYTWAVDRRDRRGHAVRHRRPGRVVSTRGPGLALAVRREDPRWPTGTPTFAPEQALPLDRALRAQLRRRAGVGARDRPRAADGRPACRCRGHPGGIDRRAGDARRPAVDDPPAAGADGRRGRVRGLISRALVAARAARRRTGR